MLIGQERAGKTSLKKSLKGEKFDPEERSTRGVDIDPSQCKITTEIWKAGERSLSGENVMDALSFEYHAAKVTLENLKGLHESEVRNEEDGDVGEQKRDDMSNEEDHRKEKPPASELSTQDRRQTPEPTQDRDETKSDTPASPKDSVGPDSQPESESLEGENDMPLNSEPELTEDIAQRIETLLQKEEQEDDDEIYCTLWDFAGQSIFYTTHPLFLTARAIYLLVHGLNRDPRERADFLLRQGSFKKVQDANLVRTNLDFLHFWMTSIASLANSEDVAAEEGSATPPPVIFVSTHADKPFNDESPRDLAREIFGSLQGKPYKSHLVRDFYVVDNSRSGSQEEDPEAKRLRGKILEIASKLPREKIPLKWLKFEKVIKAAAQEGCNRLKLPAVQQIAFGCGIAEEKELQVLLDFLHDLRIVVHFDDTRQLDDLVVLNPQWLVDIFKEVITVKPFESQQRAFEEHWRTLEETGVLKRELLEHVWSHLMNELDTVEALLSIMEKFSLICRWRSSSTTEEYLVPHMLMSHPDTEGFKELLSRTNGSSLFIRFSGSPPPQVLFPHLLVCLIREWPKRWSCTRQPELFRNAARLFFDQPDNTLVLFCHSSVIEVSLHVTTSTSSTFLEETCQRTYAVLQLALGHMCRECRWLKANFHELCVRCPVCCGGAQQRSRCSAHRVVNCREIECLHFFSETELRELPQPIRCDQPLVAVDNTVPVQMFSCWFGEVSGTCFIVGF